MRYLIEIASKRYLIEIQEKNMKLGRIGLKW
jgi:hypothetical protein